MKLSFIGGGNMATALIRGLLQRGYPAADIRAAEISADARKRLEQEFAIEARAEYAEVVRGADYVVLAVKPQQMRDVTRELSLYLDRHTVISIAAGVRCRDLAKWLNGYQSILRVMPNTPALVHSGITALYALPQVSEERKSAAEEILRAVGETFWVQDEAQLDAVTALSGSGPGYVFYFMEALERAAVELGFTPEMARRLTVQTFLGSTRLAEQSADSLATLRARVTSKGGTTERAIRTLEDAAVRLSIVQAVHAACERSRELGDELGRAG